MKYSKTFQIAEQTEEIERSEACVILSNEARKTQQINEIKLQLRWFL
jgi:hypothetical protein